MDVLNTLTIVDFKQHKFPTWMNISQEKKIEISKETRNKLIELIDNKCKLFNDLLKDYNDSETKIMETLNLLIKNIQVTRICKESHLDNIVKNYYEYSKTIRWLPWNSAKECCDSYTLKKNADDSKMEVFVSQENFYYMKLKLVNTGHDLKFLKKIINTDNVIIRMINTVLNKSLLYLSNETEQELSIKVEELINKYESSIKESKAFLDSQKNRVEQLNIKFAKLNSYVIFYKIK